MAVSTNGTFFLRASLQLLEEQQRERKELLSLVPALHLLLTETGGTTGAAAGALRAWLQRMEARQGLAELLSGPSASAGSQVPIILGPPTLRGWLRKVGGRSLSIKRRWAVLDGPSACLFYYTDRSESELKGVLRLGGAVVRASHAGPIRRAFDRAGRATWSFDVCAQEAGPAQAQRQTNTSVFGRSLPPAGPSTPFRPVSGAGVDAYTGVQRSHSLSESVASGASGESGMSGAGRGLHRRGGVSASGSMPSAASGEFGVGEGDGVHLLTSADFDGDGTVGRAVLPPPPSPASRSDRMHAAMLMQGVGHAVVGLSTAGSFMTALSPSPGGMGLGTVVHYPTPTPSQGLAGSVIEYPTPTQAGAGGIGSFFRPSPSRPPASSLATHTLPSGGGSGPGQPRDLSASMPARLGGSSHAMPFPAPLNPLHKNKRTYTWICDSESERREWVEALATAAARAGRGGESSAMEWARAFARARTLGGYIAVLWELHRAQEEEGEGGFFLRMSADWARVSMAAASRRGASVNASGGPLALLHTLGEGGDAGEGEGAGQTMALPSAAAHLSIANEKVSRKLARRESMARSMEEEVRKLSSGDSVRTRQVLAAAAAAEALSEDSRAAVAAAEASATRRRLGSVPGDRVHPAQMGRDWARDELVLNGVPLLHRLQQGVVSEGNEVEASVCALLTGVCRAILRAIAAEVGKRGHVLPAAMEGEAGLFPVLVLGPAAASVLPEWRLMAFARDVLARSCRTVAGGDGYDGLDRVLGVGVGAGAGIVLLPDSRGSVHPVRFRVHLDGDVAGGQEEEGEGGEGEGHWTPPLSGVGAGPAPPSLLSSILAGLVLSARVTSVYRLVAPSWQAGEEGSDPVEEGVARPVQLEGVGEGQGQGEVGTATVLWRRAFPWQGQAPPAMLSLHVMPYLRPATIGQEEA